MLDEMLSPLIASELRERGHDAVAVKERAELVGQPDAAVLDAATAERRAVVTNNLRDFQLLHAAVLGRSHTGPAGRGAGVGIGHHGIVFVSSSVRRTRSDVVRLADALEGLLLGCSAQGLQGQTVWLDVPTRL